MYCNNCGNLLDDNATFCTRCGQATGVQPMQQPNYQQPTYQQPVQQPAYQQPAYGQPAYQEAPYGYTPAPPQPEVSMGWFKFLIYFALFAGAVLNLISGIMMLTGSAYGTDKELVYRFYEGLQGLDTIVGVLMVILAVIGIAARFTLAGYKKIGPVLLVILYIGSAVVNIIYAVGLPSIVPEFVMQSIDMTSYYSSTASSIVFAIVNAIYFKKRSHLFVK